MNHDEYHRKFADAIIEQIKQGTAPWQKPWAPGERVMPMNVDTGTLLPGRQQPAPRLRPAGEGLRRRALGHLPPDPGPAAARSGRARPAPVSCRSRTTSGSPSPTRRAQPRRDAEGKRVYRYEKLKTPFVRQYTVFNAEQADGLPERANPTPEPLWKAHQQAEKVMEDVGVQVRHVQGDRAYYHMKRDEIVLPERGQFPDANNYYQTALHELGHSTGHPERMNRETLAEGIKNGFGSARLRAGGAPGRDQRDDDWRARRRRARPEPGRRIRRGLGPGARGGPARDPARRGGRAADLRLRARAAHRA